MKQFKGRVIAAGEVTAPALVSHGGLNTLASFQKALQFGDKMATCGDQNNPDLFGKQMVGTALCLPQTIGSTTGGMVLYCACAMKRQPACMLFSKPIDSLAAAGAVLADVWVDDVTMPVIDSLGEEFLDYVKDGMRITVDLDGTVTVEAAGGREEIACDKVLLCIGRAANLEGYGLETLHVPAEKAIMIDDHCMTGVPGVYAIGDCNGTGMLAHVAYRQAEVAVKHILG